MNASKDKNFTNRYLCNEPFRKEILEVLPLNLRNILKMLPPSTIHSMEEIRLRVNKPFIISVRNKDIFLGERGELLSSPGYIVSKCDMEKAYELITDYSVYALEEEIRNGFITIKGGHRVGICGRTVVDGQKVKTIKDISGLNIRISKQQIGISDKLMDYLIHQGKYFYNTLIVSPPQCGKTTLLRDIIRNLSSGMKYPSFPGFKVGVVDERSEICGTYQNIPQNDVGIRTDILDACPKAVGIMMLIRSMSPQIIATDEIGKQEDIPAIEEALNAGIQLITTVHGSNLDQVNLRPNLKPLMEQRIFDRIIILSNEPKVGSITKIINGKTQEMITLNSLGGRNEIVC